MNNTVGYIKGRTLSKEHIGNEVFKQLGESDYIYFSKETRSQLLSYTSSEDPKLAFDLWKNLLIDAVCILKINDYREKLYEDSKNLDTLSVNFDKIRKASSFGVDEIANYFEDFIQFEKVLYGTDEHYRDHVDHVLQVWAIGISLISHNNLLMNDKYELTKTNFHFQITEETEHDDNKFEKITQSELWSMWTIIALCHDLGYPIEKTAKINIQAKKIISHFGNMNFSELNYSFDIFNTFLVDKFLNVISSKAVFSESGDMHTIIQTKYRDKFSKSLEDYKHGIFSSLLLYKNLTFFLETDYFVSKSHLEKEDIRQFFIRKEILRSIASHTCPKVYHINLNTLSFLLIICDELQEWNRPNFNEFRFKTEGKEPKVELKEFEMSNQQKIHIQFIYGFKFSDVDVKYLVKNRFKNICCLLRTAKDDKQRKIDFKWDIITKNTDFSFSFNSNKNSFEQLSVIKKTKRGNGTVKKEEYELYD